MKNRIFLTIVALVILPTALLSIMAGRAVRNRELVIIQQMKTSASSMTRLCSENIDSAIKDELTKLRGSIGSVLMRTASVAELARTAEGIEDNSRIIDSLIVYHDPWDIIYPIRDISGKKDEADSAFIERLRIEIAGPRSSGDFLSLRNQENYYCFTLIPGRTDLYAGFNVDISGFRRLLESALKKLGTEDILLTAEGQLYNSQDAVIIDDPLSAGPQREQIKTDSPNPDTELLAQISLTKPFHDVIISAYARDPERLQEAGQNQGKLLAWGIILLSSGILAGVIILVYQIQEEIRRTSARANYIIGISHDLRTPIASLKMMTESLYSGTVKNPEKRHSFLGIMAGECERLHRLVERVLYFVRFGEDALVFYKKTVDIEDLIGQAVKTFLSSTAGTRSDYKFEVEASKELPDIEADENALSQVLLNLLDNALKYGRNGEKDESTTITIAAAVMERRSSIFRPVRKWIRISVTDSGPGINPSDLRKLFRPYFRAASAQNANTSGVGLGLALCRHIARAHSGWMEAINAPQGGAVFSIYLPFPESS